MFQQYISKKRILPDTRIKLNPSEDSVELTETQYGLKVNSDMSVFDLESRRFNYWQQLEKILDGINELDNELIRKNLSTRLRLLSEIDIYWAFPGPDVLAQLNYYLKNQDFERFYTLCHNSNMQIKNQNYRQQQFIPYRNNLNLLDQRLDKETAEFKKNHNQSIKPYFEVLIIHSGEVDFQLECYENRNIYQSDDDPFLYDLVFADKKSLAINAIMANSCIQACVYYSNFTEDLTDSQYCAYEGFIDRKLSVEDLFKYPILALKKLLQQLRPELDHHLIIDHSSINLHDSIKTDFCSFHQQNESFQNIHRALLDGILTRYQTPFFTALQNYSKMPKENFHALPLSQAQSLKNSHWTQDMLEFYGNNIFMAETSSTQGGMDSLLDPQGAIKEAHQKTAKTFQSQTSFFVVNGTSAANKIIIQANLVPSDIVLVSSDSHKSIPNAIIQTGAHPIFLETYVISDFELYGGVPLQKIKTLLLEMKKNGHLKKVKQIVLTNSTFDGIIYNVEKFMMEILSIKPDIIFHWDEAWHAHAYFNPLYKQRTAMSVARNLQKTLNSKHYKEKYRRWYRQYKPLLTSSNTDDLSQLASLTLMPDPDKTKIRVYSSQSTHKTLSAFRQGSMLHIFDELFNHELFFESFRLHTSTSPNHQILASLDVGRRQASLEGYELVKRAIRLAQQLRDAISNSSKLSVYFRIFTDKELLPKKVSSDNNSFNSARAQFNKKLTGNDAYNQRMIDWGEADFVVDPTRVTFDISQTNFSGVDFRELLIEKYHIQVNKVSDKTVLFIVNIGTTEQSIIKLVDSLHNIADNIKKNDRQTYNNPQVSLSISKDFQKKKNNIYISARQYWDKFTHYKGEHYSSVDIRAAYYAAYDERNIRYIKITSNTLVMCIKDDKFHSIISACFVTPYPPGSPILVPGQLITPDILRFLHHTKIREIHGYNLEVGLKVYSDYYLRSCTNLLNKDSSKACSPN